MQIFANFEIDAFLLFATFSYVNSLSIYVYLRFKYLVRHHDFCRLYFSTWDEFRMRFTGHLTSCQHFVCLLSFYFSELLLIKKLGIFT